MRPTVWNRRNERQGTILPMLAVCLIGLFGFVALAIDLGMLALSRTRCQNAADAAALTGCRQLSNKPGSVNNNLAQAVAAARSTVTANSHLSTNFTNGQIERIEVGQYLYNPTTNMFMVMNLANVTNNTSATPPGGSWTALRVRIGVSQPTYFMRVFGVTTMPTGAVATAVYKPRDIAFVLDMTGSMAFGSCFNFSGRSLNPDNLIPSFGHYFNIPHLLRATQNEANASGEAIARNNVTITTPGGPPIVRDFFYDPVNTANPTTPAWPVNPNNLRRALHCLPDSAETPGNADNYEPPTYNFSSYNAFDLTRANGPTPAPPWFGTMTDSGSVPYVGDRWRRANGSINKTNVNWTAGNTSLRAAIHAIELLGYNVSSGNVRGGTSGTTVIANELQFRDAVWETHGYDLDIVAYRNAKGNGPPLNPTTYNAPLVPAADRFVGYSMGPGYWGKTFYIWPPDPRFDPNADVTRPNPNRPAFDVNGRPMCDWRRRFFLPRTQIGAPPRFDPQWDNIGSNTGYDGINEALFRTRGSGMMLADNSNVNNRTYRINYPAVLRWLKTGPQTLPPNLRAGRIVYYTSIPDDVDTSTGTVEQRRDKVFWKAYIDFVLGARHENRDFTTNHHLYGFADHWSTAGFSVTTNDLLPWSGPNNSWPAHRPYMRYNDSPLRPRLHFWFGPLSMIAFLGTTSNMPGAPNGWNVMPGTCHESQCWQLKVGMNSVLDDVQNNHPNDFVGLVYFAHRHHNGIRVPTGQNFPALKNALFYPRSLLSQITSGNTTAEVWAFNHGSSNPGHNALNPRSSADIPNSSGGTDPNTGLAYAFNILSPSTQLGSEYVGWAQGQSVRPRRGAAKLIIFETDGVPNSWRGNNGNRTMDPTLRGFDTFYPTSNVSVGGSNGHPTSISEALKVAGQIVKPMATTNAVGVDSGLSLPNAPARIYPIAFGDLFDVNRSPNATFRPTALKFLADLAAAGNTGPAGATTLPPHQIITGTYQERIDKLKTCMERIFQSGVAVTLVE